MKNIAVILAGGNSTRCGFDKLFTTNFGNPVLERTISVFEKSDVIDDILVVLSAKNFTLGADLQLKFPKVSKILLGGNSRYESVKNAIEYLKVKESDNVRVLIHNGANPNLLIEDLEKGILRAKEKKNVVFGYFTPNSMKKVVDGKVIRLLNRDEIFETQTPQISDLTTFERSIESVATTSLAIERVRTIKPRDEAELLSLIGEEIYVHECDPSNRKVTYASDFGLNNGEQVIELKYKKKGLLALGGAKISKDFRIGVGEDSHRFMEEFNPEKPLVIGGITFSESGKTFDSNSDGDVVLHSLCNALLSSIGEKTFDEFATPMCKSGITDSQKYLEKTMEIVRNKYPKFKIINVVFSLEGKYPKLAPRHEDMVESLKNILSISDERIGITYTSGEGLTSFGRGVGLYCLCNIFIQSR